MKKEIEYFDKKLRNNFFISSRYQICSGILFLYGIIDNV